MHSLDFYEGIREKILWKVKDIKQFLINVIKEKKKILIVGAPARGVVILNVCGIKMPSDAVVIDDTPEKQGKYMPGIHLPVSKWEEVNLSHFDVALMLSWNYAESLLIRLKKNSFYGEVFVPLPNFMRIN